MEASPEDLSVPERSHVRGRRQLIEVSLREAGVVAATLGFSVWFAARQFDAVSPTFRANAPFASTLPTIITTGVALLCIYAALRLTARPTSRTFASSWPATARAVVFVASVLAAIMLSPLAGVILLLASGALVAAAEFGLTARAEDYRRILEEYLVSFAVILGADWLLVTSVSPTYFVRAPTRSGITYLIDAALAPNSFVNAFSYSFSTYQHGFWGAVQDVPTGLASVVLSILAFLHLVPLWEVSSFFKLVYLMVFGFFVAASWFFYLFLRQVRMSRPVATAAGAVYVAGNAFFMRAVASDQAWYLTEYVVLPAALFAVAKAFRSGSMVAAAWAGLAVASQFYLMAPHPEATIYSVAVFAILALSYVCLPEHTGAARGRALTVCIVSGEAFVLSAGSYLAPIAAAVLAGTMDVVGRKIVLAPGYHLLIPTFYFVAIGLGGAAELYREYRLRRANWAVAGFLGISVLSLALGVPGIADAIMEFTQRNFGWAVHLLPQDRFLTWLGLGTVAITAFGVDAGLMFVRRSRWWGDVISRGGHWRVVACDATLALGGTGLMVLLLLGNANSARVGMVFDKRTEPFYEPITSVLANSLAPVDQAASVPYLRRRLAAFEAEAKRSDPAWALFAAALRTEGVASARELGQGAVRPFAQRVAAVIDASYLRVPGHEALPQHPNSYLAGLGDPYARVMTILGWDHQTDFLGAGHNIKNMHDTAVVYDTSVTIGFPAIHALYMYPLSSLGEFHVMKQVLPNYAISWRRLSWIYYDDDVFGDPAFRKILNIGGVSDYVTLRSEAVRQAVTRDGSGLVMLPDSSYQRPPDYYVIADTRAYDQAYLARPVAPKAPIDAARAEAAVHAYYRDHIGDAAYRTAIVPLLDNLLALEQRHDALIEGAASAPPASDNPSTRGGSATIDGSAGPRTGIEVVCPDPSCWLVYNLAALPGWRAYIDGRRAPIARANYAFLAVPVPQGRHYVGFFYLPLVSTCADIASLSTLLVLLVWSGIPRHRSRS